MIFSLTVSTPANTVKTDVLRTPIKLFLGLIYHVEIYFPPGSWGLLGVQLHAGGHQLYPYNNGGWFYGEDMLFKYDDLEYFTISTAQMDIVTYNLDEQFDHKVMVNIGIMTNKQFQQAIAPENSTTDLIAAVDSLTAAIKAQLPTKIRPKTVLLGNKD